MTHRLATNYAKNYCNRTLTVKVIVENVVTCFFGTQCRTVLYISKSSARSILINKPAYELEEQTYVPAFYLLNYSQTKQNTVLCKTLRDSTAPLSRLQVYHGR